MDGFAPRSPLNRPGDVIRISSRSTFFYKRVFPAIWFGCLGVFVCAAGIAAMAQQQPAQWLPLIGVPIFMAIFGYAIMKRFVFDLVDEVWDCGDSILVRNEGLEYRFALSDFTKVAYTGFINPPRITLFLCQASDDLGTKVAFISPFRLFPYSIPPVAKDLMARIDASRQPP